MELTQMQKLKLQEKKQEKQQKTNQLEKQSDEEGSEQQNNNQGQDNAQKKKKKKKKNNKKKKKPTQNVPLVIPKVEGISVQQLNAQTQTNQRFRLLGGWPNPVKQKFPNNQFQGYGPNQIHQYKVPRVKTEELKAKQALLDQHIQFLRKGAQIQRQVRRFAQRIIKPGRKLIDICQELQNYNRQLAPEKGLDSGIAFPTGCSINHCAAHYTPNPGDDIVLKYDDVCKIDFGTHIKGRIIDCAFTVAFNPKFDKLLEAVKDATNTGVKQAGIDVRLGQIGQKIEQVMTSYEVEIDGKVFPVKVVKNLNGHSIDPYKIHAGKTVPCVKNNSTVKMQEGQVYAIQTFGSTGKGHVKQEGDCSHYMKDFHLPPNVKIPGRSKAFYNYVSQRFDTLAFCKRWIQKDNVPNYILPLRDLVQNGIINPYPPLCDIQGSYVAQYQHTLVLRPTVKQVLSRGDDF